MAKKRLSEKSGRAKLPSPGRPSKINRTNQAQFWRLIAEGVGSEDAAIEVGASPVVGHRWFRENSEMLPTQFMPSAPSPTGRYLSFAKREEIALGRARGLGVNTIARSLGRSSSTISRELRRNAAIRSGGLEYRATTAQWHADRAAKRPKPSKIAQNARLRSYIEERLAGRVIGPNGKAHAGPEAAWTKRRSVRRQHRRWGFA